MILPFHPLKRQVAVWLLAGLAVAVYSFVPWLTSRDQVIVLNSPDETANFVYATRLAKGFELGILEPLNAEIGNIIHPRSTTVRDGQIVPVSFLGFMFLLGSLGALFGVWILPFVTPMFTGLALIALYDFCRERFGSRVAVVTFALTASQAAIIYFASRSFFHNLLFLDFLLLALWGYGKWVARRRTSDFAFWILMVLVALLIRTSEIFWVIPVVLFVLWQERRFFSRSYALTGGILIAVVASLVFGLSSLYGLSGLAEYQAPATGTAAGGSSIVSFIKNLFPFGLHPIRALGNFFSFYLFLFPHLAVLAFIGVWGAWNRFEYRWLLKLGAWMTGLLVLFYGSAVIHDSVGFSAPTIGSSYVRYWLPLVVVWMPFVSLGLLRLVDLVEENSRRVFLTVCLCVFATVGFLGAFFDPIEGLAITTHRLAVYRAVRLEVMARTGEEAVIVSDQSDKLFFADRRVVTPGDRPLSSYEEIRVGLPVLAERIPVYLYARSVSSEEREAFEKIGLVLSQPAPLSDGAWLYPLIRL